MNIYNNILIFSVFQKGQTWEANRNAHVKAMQFLKTSLIPHMELTGRYDGNDELSILVDGFKYRDVVAMFCKANNQECYLESHNDRATFLVFPDGKVQGIGRLTGVSKEEAMGAIGYSYNPLVDQYFITK